MASIVQTLITRPRYSALAVNCTSVCEPVPATVVTTLSTDTHSASPASPKNHCNLMRTRPASMMAEKTETNEQAINAVPLHRRKAADDIDPNEPSVKRFWSVLRSFDDAERSAFLRFVWARSRLPPAAAERLPHAT